MSRRSDGLSSADTLRLALDDAHRLAQGGNPAYRQTESSLGLNPVETRTTWLSELIPELRLSLFDRHRRQNLVNRERVLASSTALTKLRVDVRRRHMEALEQRKLGRAEEELAAARELDRKVA